MRSPARPPTGSSWPPLLAALPRGSCRDRGPGALGRRGREDRADPADLAEAAERLAAAAPDLANPCPWSSPPDPLGDLGLGTANPAMAMDGIEAYVAAREAEFRTVSAPRVPYPSAEAWLQAVPIPGPDSRRAEQMLLAVPLPDAGRRDALVADDPDALIRRIVLSPVYQLK